MTTEIGGPHKFERLPTYVQQPLASRKPEHCLPTLAYTFGLRVGGCSRLLRGYGAYPP